MNSINLKAKVLTVLIALGVYGICPATMYLQTKNFAAKVSALKKKNHVTSLAVNK